jgi:hypothetical protein
LIEVVENEDAVEVTKVKGKLGIKSPNSDITFNFSLVFPFE